MAFGKTVCDLFSCVKCKIHHTTKAISYISLEQEAKHHQILKSWLASSSCPSSLIPTRGFNTTELDFKSLLLHKLGHPAPPKSAVCRSQLVSPVSTFDPNHPAAKVVTGSKVKLKISFCYLCLQTSQYFIIKQGWRFRFSYSTSFLLCPGEEKKVQEVQRNTGEGRQSPAAELQSDRARH